MSELNQRHQLVLLFTDLTDSTQIAARLEPEHYADLLSQLRHHTHTIIARHGGEVVRVDGDGALCIFGYPLAHEDAGRRATEAALDLHAAVAELASDTAILLHSGIHAGVVLLRGGDLVRGRYEMLGDATNVAARLCDAAGAGGILVSAETLGADRHFFLTDAERAIALSGHAEPLRVLPVLAREDVPHRFAAREIRGLSRFVGRQSERAQVNAWLNDPALTTPVMLIHGPAGIGKSRLLKVVASDFADQAWTVERGYCEGYLGAPPLQPLLQIASGLDSGFAADHDLSARIEAMIRANATRSLLLIIDDWQWADDASRNLINRLASECPPKLRLLLLSRDADAGLAPDCKVAEIAVGPLDHKSARATIESLLATKDPFAITQIDSATGGSPLLIEELCHAYSDHGPTATGSKLRGAWFDLSVQSRFASLAAEDAQLLRLAAVIGRVVMPWLLAGVRGTAIDGAMLERLQDADFLFPDDAGDMLRFKHGLTRDAVYAAIGLAERKALHAQVLQALEERAQQADQGQYLDALAYHACEAGLRQKALPYTLQAGDAALTKGALDRVQVNYAIAFGFIATAQPSPELVVMLRHVLKMFGRACVVDPDLSHVPVLDQMLECAERFADKEAIALATYWIGAHFYGLGEPKRSLRVLTRALAAAEDLGGEPFVVQVHANLGQSHAIAGQYQQARIHMDLAITKKRAFSRSHIPSSSLAYCQSSRGLMLADIGDFAGAYRDFDESIVAMAGADDPILASLDTQRCLALIYNGQFSEAAERAQASEELAVRSHARFLVFSARALSSYARWQMTGNRQEFDSFAEATMMLHTSNRFQRISFKYAWIAEAMADREEVPAARLFAGLAFRRALKGDRLGEASAARALALVAARERSGRFHHYLAQADRAARTRLSPREAALNRMCEAQCQKLLGNIAAARAAAAQASTAFADLNIPHWHERLAQLLD